MTLFRVRYTKVNSEFSDHFERTVDCSKILLQLTIPEMFCIKNCMQSASFLVLVEGTPLKPERTKARGSHISNPLQHSHGLS